MRNERGQASVMIGMMMMTFILLFAFVVNTGMLVNAKINLQNAADLAAYSGAAVQARQLSDISYLNYEMRRQYKKFLFRYYVVGNMASGYFPRGGGGSSSSPQWGPGPESSLIYGVPAVCVAFTSTGPSDNYCQIGSLPGIPIPPNNSVLGAFDQINTTLGEQLTAIEQLREQHCGKIATANTTLLLLWLFNTSPDLQSLSAAVTGNDTASQNERAIMQVAQAAAQGLGLVPREFILNERANTLASYVNAPAQTHVTMAAVNSLKQSIDPPANERTIQAFLSAYYTLGNHTFSDDNAISMDELLPSGGDQSNLLVLDPVKENFDAYSVQFQLNPTAVNGNPNSHNCDPQLAPVTIHNIPVGVAKDPSVLTFYAVRLTATAKVMFSPFGDMTLTAYAAARPFGSRIGPPVSAAQSQFVMEGAASADAGVPTNSGTVGAIPNLPITLQEAQAALGPGKGWDNNAVLGALYSQFFPGGSPNGPTGQELGETNFSAGIQAAMVPNPAEGNSYNIYNMDPTAAPDPFAAGFDALHQLTFWAPIVPPEKASDLKTVLGQDFAEVLQGTPTPGNSIPTTGGNATQALMTALGNNIYSYVEALGSAQGEILAGSPDAGGRCNPGSCVQEGINLAHIQDPFVQANGQPIQLGSSIMIPESDIAAYKTSYVSTLDSAIQAEGRVGYSVKFVSFDSLIKTGTDATGGGPIDKPSGFLDSQAQQDVVKIQH